MDFAGIFQGRGYSSLMRRGCGARLGSVGGTFVARCWAIGRTLLGSWAHAAGTIGSRCGNYRLALRELSAPAAGLLGTRCVAFGRWLRALGAVTWLAALTRRGSIGDIYGRYREHK